MTISLVGFSIVPNISNTSSKAVAVEVAAGAVGNLLVAAYNSSDALNPGSLTEPSGWHHILTNIDSRDGVYSNGNYTNHFDVAWTFRTNSDSLTWNTGLVGGDDQIALMEFSGAFDPVNPITIHSAYTEVSAPNLTIPSVTPNVVSSVLVSLAWSRGYTSSVVDAGYPTGMTGIFNRQTRSNSAAVRTAAAYLQLGAVAATGPVVWNAFRADSNGQLGGLNLIINSGALPQTIGSFNNGAALTVGQPIVNASLNGFSALPTATATYTGGSIPVSATTGSKSAVAFALGDRVDGSPYPDNGTPVTVTYVNGVENAVVTAPIYNKPEEVEVTFGTVNTADATTLAKKLSTDGHVVTGGTFTYIPYGDLSIGTDAGMTFTTTGKFGGWFRPVTNGTNGSTAGCVYFYLIDTGTGVITTVTVDLTVLKANHNSPRYDSLYSLGNRP